MVLNVMCYFFDTRCSVILGYTESITQQHFVYRIGDLLSAACCQLVVWIARHIRLCFCYGSSCIIYLHQSNSRLGLTDNASAHRKISPAAHCSKQARFPLCLSTAECQFCSCDSLFRLATFDVVIVSATSQVHNVDKTKCSICYTEQQPCTEPCLWTLRDVSCCPRLALSVCRLFLLQCYELVCDPLPAASASSAPHPHNYGYCGALNTAPAIGT